MSIFSGIIGATSASNAAEAQSDAARYAAELQWKMYRQGRKDLAPFLRAGRLRLPYETQAFKEYYKTAMAGPGKFEESPYYASLMESIGQGANALAARGLVTGAGAGPASKELLQYALPATTAARGGWLNEWLGGKLNPLGTIAYGQNPGLGVAQQTSGNALVAGQGLAQSAMYGGEARASGYLGRGAALSNMIGGAGNALLFALGGGLGGLGGAGAGAAGSWANYGRPYIPGVGGP